MAPSETYRGRGGGRGARGGARGGRGGSGAGRGRGGFKVGPSHAPSDAYLGKGKHWQFQYRRGTTIYTNALYV